MTGVSIGQLKNASKIGCVIVSGEKMMDSSIFKDFKSGMKRWEITYNPPNLCTNCFSTE